MFRRLLGLILVIMGLAGVALSVAGVIVGRRVVDQIGSDVLANLELTSQTLDTVEETLLLAKTMVSDVNTGLQTVEDTAVNVSSTLRETRPLLNQIDKITTEEIPNSLEAVQSTVPNVVAVAGAVDTTLKTLNDFRIDETILGLEITYDLGIDYDPEVPFDESVQQVGDSLEGLPGQLRGLKVYLNVSSNNLDAVSRDLLRISRDLETINGRVAETQPLLDEYIGLVIEVNDRTRQTRASLKEQLEIIKLIITVAMIWLGLNQLVPLYLGWEMLTGRRQNAGES